MPSRGASYTLEIGDEERQGTADAGGWLFEDVVASSNRCTVCWGEGDDAYELDVYLRVESVRDPEAQVRQGLHNLGYHTNGSLSDAIARFEVDQGMLVSGQVSAVVDRVLQLNKSGTLDADDGQS